jgi:hypothetical protein
MIKWLNEHPSKSAEHPGKMTPNEHSDDVIAKQRRIAYSLMVRISDRSGEFPPSMVLEGVKLQGEPKEPMAKGGFAQVFKGTYKGDSVAIKRVNLPAEFSASDLSHALIVSPWFQVCWSARVLTGSFDRSVLRRRLSNGASSGTKISSRWRVYSWTAATGKSTLAWSQPGWTAGL